MRAWMDSRTRCMMDVTVADPPWTPGAAINACEQRPGEDRNRNAFALSRNSGCAAADYIKSASSGPGSEPIPFDGAGATGSAHRGAGWIKSFAANFKQEGRGAVSRVQILPRRIEVMLRFVHVRKPGCDVGQKKVLLAGGMGTI